MLRKLTKYFAEGPRNIRDTIFLKVMSGSFTSVNLKKII